MLILLCGIGILILFQYRKRYGLHAITEAAAKLLQGEKFQYRKRYGLHAIDGMPTEWETGAEFQYRKRYGLHATVYAAQGLACV